MKYFIKNSQDLAKVIKAARKNAKLSQQEVAAGVSLGRRAVAEVEGGKPTAQMKTIFQLLEGLGIDIEITITPELSEQINNLDKKKTVSKSKSNG